MQAVSRTEKARLGINRIESQFRDCGFKIIAGIDEAGRGPLAGPVVAAACILPLKFLLPGIDDSKKLTPAKRDLLFNSISSYDNIDLGVGIVGHELIDQINIYEATKQAMLAAVADLTAIPDLLLVDGMKLSCDPILSEKIINGDELVLSIAAASIIAKVTRDRLMFEYHEMWPEYGFDKHKGYGTEYHLEALKRYGPCPIHRLTFKPVADAASHLVATK